MRMGKDRLASSPRLIGQPGQPVLPKAENPLAGVAEGQSHRLSGVLGGAAFGQKQDQAGASGQTCGESGGTEPALQLDTLGIGEGHGKGFLAAAHGDTEGSRHRLSTLRKIRSLSPLCSCCQFNPFSVRRCSKNSSVYGAGKLLHEGKKWQQRRTIAACLGGVRLKFDSGVWQSDRRALLRLAVVDVFQG
jgi:hypothetical protein